MKRSHKIYLVMLLLFCINSLSEAQTKNRTKNPYVSVKSNVLYDLTTTLNRGIEVGLGKHTSLDISASYNPWEFNDDKMVKLWFLQPEFRYWLNDRSSGHFFGIHSHYGEYNIHGMNLFNTRYTVKQGNLYGAGLSYGYNWRLADHWSIEASLGIGYARLRYDVYDCIHCDRYIETKHKNYWGPTKAAVSIIYIIK